jgi:hypothetical protein
MTLWLHSTILATSLAACVAVGLASASIHSGMGGAAAKTDRLPVATETNTAYRTVETRMDGVSVLTRLPLAEMN